MIHGLTERLIEPLPVTNENTSTSVPRSNTPLFAVLVLVGSFSGVVDTMFVLPVRTSAVAVPGVLP